MKNSAHNHRVFMGSGKFQPKIEGDVIQGDVINFEPPPQPNRKDLSQEGKDEVIDVKSEPA